MALINRRNIYRIAFQMKRMKRIRVSVSTDVISQQYPAAKNVKSRDIGIFKIYTLARHFPAVYQSAYAWCSTVTPDA